jgi:Uma2 family endonuclease
MSLTAEKRRFTEEEYLRLEQAAPIRHEYHDGEITAMSGGSYAHSLIIMNVGAALHAALAGKPCQVLESNLKVGIVPSRRFVYPDLQIICGPPQFDCRDSSLQTVTNSRVVIEVLSPSTEAYDRGLKFSLYRELESFEEYILVSQDAASVETFFRRPDGTWLFTPSSGLDAVVRLRSLELVLRLADVYARVEFPQQSPSVTDPLATQRP